MFILKQKKLLRIFHALWNISIAVIGIHFAIWECDAIIRTLNWHCTKWDCLNILLVIQYIWCFKIFWGSANTLLQISLEMGENEEKCWVQHILWISKILFCFWIEAYIFFQMVIFATLFRRCPTLWKSMLKRTILFRRCTMLFNSTLKNTTLF